jgi:hypothetical protein
MLETHFHIRRFAIRTALAMALAGALCACPPSSGEPKGTSGDPPATCTKVGDACTFAPGKLGLCVENAAGNAVICQSQH